MRRAVFLDRDGTLIALVHHLTKASDVQLLPGAGQAVFALRERGYACVLVTNQSVIGRGLLTVTGLEEIHQELLRQLSAHRTALDGIYYCPVAPTVSDPRTIEHPDRKPGPGMLLRAARELGLQIGQSWMVGDSLSDLLAGRNAGCAGSVLVKSGYGSSPGGELDKEASYQAEDLLAAAHWIIGMDAARDGAREEKEES